MTTKKPPAQAIKSDRKERVRETYQHARWTSSSGKNPFDPKVNGEKAWNDYNNAVKMARSAVGDTSNVNPINGPIAGSHKAKGK